tara:strand:- start:10 stop:627 length:618 start_codon:yes stop_codon:yes gene_type:complete
MQFSPRVLLVDTIGFIDDIPSDLLDAFSATLEESLECDLLLLLLDCSDPVEEVIRKFETSRRELFDRTDPSENQYDLLVVLTKHDSCSESHVFAVTQALDAFGVSDTILTSSTSSEGIEQLRSSILTRLHGPPMSFLILPPNKESDRPIAAIESEIRRNSMVRERRMTDEGLRLVAWIDLADWGRLNRSLGERIHRDVDSSSQAE